MTFLAEWTIKIQSGTFQYLISTSPVLLTFERSFSSKSTLDDAHSTFNIYCIFCKSTCARATKRIQLWCHLRQGTNYCLNVFDNVFLVFWMCTHVLMDVTSKFCSNCICVASCCGSLKWCINHILLQFTLILMSHPFR